MYMYMYIFGHVQCTYIRTCRCMHRIKLKACAHKTTLRCCKHLISLLHCGSKDCACVYDYNLWNYWTRTQLLATIMTFWLGFGSIYWSLSHLSTRPSSLLLTTLRRLGRLIWLAISIPIYVFLSLLSPSFPPSPSILCLPVCLSVSQFIPLATLYDVS